jgi:L-rhamnose mutarotase
MMHAVLEQLLKLPESAHHEVLSYLQNLVKKREPETYSIAINDRKGLFGVWKEKVWTADDFDAPLEDLAEYM